MKFPLKFPLRCFALGFLILGQGIQSDQIAVGVPTPSNDTIPFQLGKAYAGRFCESAVLTGIRLGAKELESSVLLLFQAPASLPSDIDGYIGTNLLHAQVIELDFASETLRWQ